MGTVQIPAQSIPVIAKTDVLVVSSGPGGLSAAISSARPGVETMLVKRYSCFGGNLTNVVEEGIARYRHHGIGGFVAAVNRYTVLNEKNRMLLHGKWITLRA